jgi:hypothetical protein
VNYRYLPFHAHKATINTDIDEQARDFAKLAPISEFSCLPGHHYRSEWVAASANHVTIIAGSASSHRQRQDAMSSLERVSLFIPIKGTHTFQSQGKQLVMNGSESMLFYPPVDRTYETTDMSAVIIQANATGIAKRVLAMGPNNASLVTALARLQQPQQFLLNESLNKHIFSTIRKVLTVINAIRSESVELPAHSEIDTVVEKCFAALLFPELMA